VRMLVTVGTDWAEGKYEHLDAVAWPHTDRCRSQTPTVTLSGA
jgi:hypothetical protein